MRLIEPYFRLPHEVPNLVDGRIINGMILVVRYFLCWRDASADYSPPNTSITTLYAGAVLACSQLPSASPQPSSSGSLNEPRA